MFRTWVLICLFLIGCEEHCGSAAHQPTQNPPSAPKPTFRIAFVTDTKGYLEPCGCTSRPLGGIDKLAGQIERLKQDGVPLYFMATGDLFFGGPVLDEGALVQEHEQASTLINIWNSLGLVAATVGQKDFSRPNEVNLLHEQSHFPWLLSGQANYAGFRVIGEAQYRLGIVGISDLPNIDTFEAAKASVRTAREEGANFLVVMVRGDRRLARAVAQLEGVNLVLHGGIDTETPSPPISTGRSIVLQGGRQGQRLIVVDVYMRHDGPFRDGSLWSRETERESLQTSIRELETNIERWEHDHSASPSDIAIQKERLQSMKHEVQTLDQPADISQGNIINARVIELENSLPSETTIANQLRDYDRRINEHNRTALANRTPIEVPQGQSTYVGSQACQSCHAPAYQWWQNHQHGRAYQTLVDRNKEYSLACVNCHVTGYGQPGGATVTHNLNGLLTNVGCESCHGPGSAHVSHPAATNIHRIVPETTCTNCHNSEHSDRFVYDAFRRSLLVQGHGLETTTR